MLVACCAVGRNENLFPKFDIFSMAFAGIVCRVYTWNMKGGKVCQRSEEESRDCPNGDSNECYVYRRTDMDMM